MARCDRQKKRGASASSRDSLAKQAGSKQFHGSFSHLIGAVSEQAPRHIDELVLCRYVRFKCRIVAGGRLYTASLMRHHVAFACLALQ
jgi:hypothetical protein